MIFPESNDIYVAWTEPESDGGSPIVYSEITATSQTDPTEEFTARTTEFGQTSINMLVERNDTYDFSAVAVNPVGESPAVTLPVFIPFAQPLEVVNLQTLTNLRGTATYYWQPPANSTQTGALTYRYRLQSQEDYETISGRTVQLTNLPGGEGHCLTIPIL